MYLNIILPALTIILSIGVIYTIFKKRYVLLAKDEVLQKKLERKEKREEKKKEQELNEAENEPQISEEIMASSNTALLFRQAMDFYAEGQFEESKMLFIKLMSLDPTHFEARLKLGLIYLMDEENEKAEHLFDELCNEQEHRDAVCLSNLALALYNGGKLEESAEAYEKAVQIDDQRAARFINLGHVYEELEKQGEALSNYEKAVALEPENIDYLFSLASLLSRLEQVESAKMYLNRILEIDPENKDASKLLKEV